MEFMKDIPDKYYELAIVDPPYGSCKNEEWDKKKTGRFGGRFKKYKIKRTRDSTDKKHGDIIKHWDIAPDNKYFEELFRISKNQLIFGGNYFGLPPNRHFIIWDKGLPEKFSMGMCEYIWSSLNNNPKIYKQAPQDSQRFHPTQKPVELYLWILKNYAKKNDKIFDSHVGSGGLRIACDELQYDFEGCELDKDYWEAQENRYKKYKQQLNLF